MRDVRNAIHRSLKWNGDLLLHLFRGNSRPLRDDLDVVVGYVRVGFYRKVVERDDAPNEQQNAERKHKQTIVECESNEEPNHGSFLVIFLPIFQILVHWR